MRLRHIEDVAVKHIEWIMAKGWPNRMSGASITMLCQSALMALGDMGNGLLGEVRPIVAFTDESGGTVGTRMAKTIVVGG